ncbi:MAG: hypothetical protein FJZ01_22175 [Candidatus Sericytochromatia bacterium]|nr:hypothetical protein [Candidatus Tanganyikabacteria bacterium]
MRVEGREYTPARVEHAPHRLERSEFRAALAAATWAAAQHRAGGRDSGRLALVQTEPVSPDGGRVVTWQG